MSRGGRFFLVAVLCHLLGPTVKSILDRYFGLATLAFLALLLGGFYVVGRVARGRRPAASADDPQPAEGDARPTSDGDESSGGSPLR